MIALLFVLGVFVAALLGAAAACVGYDVVRLRVIAYLARRADVRAARARELPSRLAAR